MDLLFPLLSSAFLYCFIIVGANHASLEPQIYWRTILPHTPMISAIEHLLKHNVYDNTPDSSVNVGKDGIIMNTGKGTSVNFEKEGVNVGHGGFSTNMDKELHDDGVAVKPKGKPVDDHNNLYPYTKLPNDGITVKPKGKPVNDHSNLFHYYYLPTNTELPDEGVFVKPKGKPVDDHGNLFHYYYTANDTELHDDGVDVKPEGKPVDDHGNLFHYYYAANDTELHDDVDVKPKGKLVDDHGNLFHYYYAANDTELHDDGVDVKPEGKPVDDHGNLFHYYYAANDTELHDDGVDVKPKGKPVDDHSNIFHYYHYAANDTELHDDGIDVKPKGKPVDDHSNIFHYYHYASNELHDNAAITLFFLRQDLRRGKHFTLQLADNAGPAKTFISRSLAESIPFSRAELPAILSRFSIQDGSTEAAAMEKTLSDCEVPTVAGEKMLCATSLEQMVDFVTMSLGTREVVALETKGGSFAGDQLVYKVGLVRTVAAVGRNGVVSCHPQAYAYAVFFCHSTTSSEAYEVEMAAEGGGTRVKAVAVCHTDTSSWNPKHLAFKVLNVKPGTVPVCHFLPQDHLVWAEKV